MAAPAASLTVAARQIEVLGKAAKVYGITGPDGKSGLRAREGDRFTGLVDNQSGADLILHWHGQALALNADDRTRPNGGVQPNDTQEAYDFPNPWHALDAFPHPVRTATAGSAHDDG